MQRTVFVPVGMLVGAAYRAGGVVMQRCAQLLDTLAGRGLGQLERALGLGGGGNQGQVGFARRGGLPLGVVARGLQGGATRGEVLLALD